MSDDDKLLTRRQILGFFGASTGAAIVGTGAANLESGDGQGNLYGGVAEMAEPHKIGENMWKGPLSVRSDIPKQDGNDFIQTDAGPSNNQYAMHHYNGGWSKQGLDAKSVSADKTDSDSFPATYSIKTKPALQFNDDSATFKYDPAVTLRAGQQIVVQDNNQIFTQQSTFFDPATGHIYQTKDGELQHVATANVGYIGNVQQVAVNQQSHWLVIAGNSAPYTAYAYGSPSDIDNHTSSNNTALASMSNVYAPTVGSIESYRDQSSTSTRGFLWAEYQNDGASEVRIIQYDGSGPTFNTVLTVSTSTVQHFHSLDVDPYNEGHFYATTGDTNSEVKWYKSTDWGNDTTWGEVSSTGGSQDYRTLNLSFGPNSVYWAMDQKNPCYLYGASRNDLGNPEVVGEAKSGFLSYGTARIWNPNGVVMSTRDNANQGFDTAPMYFYDIETGIFRKIHEHTLNYNTGNRPGVQSILKYQDELTGSIYIEMNGVDQGRTMPSFYTTEFEITKLQ